jgi:broad specificity phosphatase PhoE
MTTRLHLLCSASTSSTSSVGFPADQPLDARGRKSLEGFSGRLPSSGVVLRSPALAAAQTAEALELDAKPESSLHDCGFGRWAGRSLAEVQAEEGEAVAEWLRNPCAAPHGGESFADVMARVGGWMDGLLAGDGAVLAITHATIIRAVIAHALGAGPAAFRHIDVSPLTRANLSAGGGRWTLAALTPLRDER